MEVALISLFVLLVVVCCSVSQVMDWRAVNDGRNQHPAVLAIICMITASGVSFFLIGSNLGLLSLLIWFASIPLVVWMLWDVGLWQAVAFGGVSVLCWFIVTASVPVLRSIAASVAVGSIIAWAVVWVNDQEAMRLIKAKAADGGYTITSIQKFSDGFGNRSYAQATAQKEGCRYFWDYESQSWKIPRFRHC